MAGNVGKLRVERRGCLDRVGRRLLPPKSIDDADAEAQVLHLGSAAKSSQQIVGPEPHSESWTQVVINGDPSREG